MSSPAAPPSGPPLKYPRGAFFILAGYLLERFVYYGLFGGAVFYMQRMLGFSSSSASTVKAVMEGLIYLAPIAGAILADTYLGKARTVFIMCCCYTVGALIYSLSSATPIMASVDAAKVTGISGLLVLGIAAGLMKAVYSSLGADQFKVPEQREQQQRFFYAFYWMINAGAFLGQFMTAQLRDTVQCFGDDCYLLPYLILVGFMAVSTTIFALGRSRYIEAPPDTMLLRAMRCVTHAVRRKWDGADDKAAHWVDRARDRFDGDLIRDVKITLRVLLLFCTYPLFWALFYQTSTGMIFQAKRLDGRVGESYRIPPEMSSTINPLLILTLIPLFDQVIYPLLGRLGVLTSTTSRMIAGMAFAVSSFIVYALVNMSVEQTLIPSTHARLHVYNALPCEAALHLPPELHLVDEAGERMAKKELMIPLAGQVALPEVEVGGAAQKVEVQVSKSCAAGGDLTPVQVVLLGAHESSLVLTAAGPRPLAPSLEYLKNEDAEAKVRVIVVEGDVAEVTLKYETQEEKFPITDGLSEFQILSPKPYEVMVGGAGVVGAANVFQDGVYDVVVLGGAGEDEGVRVFPMTAPSSVHMGWLFPQYFLLTVGEVLFSVSGMDFAYSEAPAAMKSILQAANLFTITVGLWLFAGLKAISSATRAFEHRASHEALLYAGLMAANTIIFTLLLRWYNSVPKEDPLEEKGEERKDAEKRAEAGATAKDAHDNPGFVEDHAV